MKKTLNFIIISFYCFKLIALSPEMLESAFNGEFPLFVVNVTKYGTDSFSHEEIDPLFQNLKEQISPITSYPHLIIFNEYFFGKEPLNATTKEILLKQFDSFENAIFVANFILLETKDISIYEIDRTINMIRESFTWEEIAAKKFKVNTYKPEGTPKQMQLTNAVQFAQKNFSVYQQGLNDKYLLFLKKKILYTNSEFVNIPCLENISFYYHKNIPLMKYNKATYFNEFLLSTQSNKPEYPFYRFGCGADLILDNDNTMSKILHNNVSTEICRDVCIGIRKDSPFKKLHIIQSNTINIENYKIHIPTYNYLILSDPTHNECFDSFKSPVKPQYSTKNSITCNIFELNFNN